MLTNLFSRRKRQIGYVGKSKMSKTSYSQCGEDLIVDYVFRLRGVTRPSYIDIGANHPYFLSNTAKFYIEGSRGINIDANPLAIVEFEKERKDDINLNVGIGPYETELEFFIFDDSTLSTFSKEEAERISQSGKHRIESTKKVKVTTIGKVISEYNKDQFPDFFSLDVEGLDFEILKSVDFKKYSPKIICVEAAEYSPIGAGKRKEYIIEYLKNQGFYEYGNTNLNSIMLKSEFWFI